MFQHHIISRIFYCSRRSTVRSIHSYQNWTMCSWVIAVQAFSRRPPSAILNFRRSSLIDYQSTPRIPCSTFIPNLVQTFQFATEIFPENKIQNCSRWRITSTSGSGFDHKAVSLTHSASRHQISSKSGNVRGSYCNLSIFKIHVASVCHVCFTDFWPFTGP